MFLCLAGSFFLNICCMKPVTARLRQIPVTRRTRRSLVKTEFKNLLIRLARILFLAADKNIAGRPDRFNEGRISRIVVQLVPEPAHRDIDRTVEGVPFDSPQLFQDLVPVQDFSAVSREQRQRREFIRGEIDDRSVELYDPLREIDLQPSKPFGLSLVAPLRPPEDRLDP